ncbi:hypothetical protein B0H12DRAFT_1097588 [Mycena haematopus]|nr:hypothetical protein B0H12DRAFT_1097588 [Mycena haematopus]
MGFAFGLSLSLSLPVFFSLCSLAPDCGITSQSAAASSSNTPGNGSRGVAGVALGNATSRGESKEAWRFVKEELRWGASGRLRALGMSLRACSFRLWWWLEGFIGAG